jgi:DNA repair protein RadC
MAKTTRFRHHEVLLQVVRPERVLRTAETSQAVARVAHDLLPDDGREHFATLLVDGRLQVLGRHLVAVGGLDGVKVSGREVFGAALRILGTDAVILVHNRPSGAARISGGPASLYRSCA